MAVEEIGLSNEQKTLDEKRIEIIKEALPGYADMGAGETSESHRMFDLWAGYYDGT